MDHKHVSHLFDIQQRNNWKNWAANIDTFGNVLHSFEDSNLVESFLNIYPNMYTKIEKIESGKTIMAKKALEMNLDYFIKLLNNNKNNGKKNTFNVDGKVGEKD